MSKAKNKKIKTVMLKKSGEPKDGALVLVDPDDVVIAMYPLKFSGKEPEVASMRKKIKWFFKEHAKAPRDGDPTVRMKLRDANGDVWLCGPSHPDYLWRVDEGVFYMDRGFRLIDESGDNDAETMYGLLNLLDLTMGRKELRGPVEWLTLDEIAAERVAS
jgi:hypothetical protein